MSDDAVSCTPDAHIPRRTTDLFKDQFRPCNRNHTPSTLRLVDVLQELAKGHHDKVEAFLDRALALSIDVGDPITRVSEPTKRSMHVA